MAAGDASQTTLVQITVIYQLIAVAFTVATLR